MQRFRNFFLFVGILLLILGVRIFIGIRFVSPLPQADDWFTLPWLQNWSNGVRDWGFIFQRTNNHPMSMYYAITLLQFMLNGYWDTRLDFLASAFIHTAYAAVVLLTFRNVLDRQDRGWLLAVIFFLFAIPFAGYRINWGIIWPHSMMMLFCVWALYVAAYHNKTWSGVACALLLAYLAALNMAAGCLGALAVAGLTFFRAAVARRLTSREIVLSVGGLVLFICFYFTMQREGASIGLVEAGNAFFKAVAWPVVFTPLAGFFSIVPLAALAIAYIWLPSFRTRNMEFILGAGGLVFLVAIATGVARGDNNAMGRPSGRYTEIFVLVPLICGVALYALNRGLSGNYKRGIAVFTLVWVGLQILGFSIHIFYRTLPFIAHENGEWSDPDRQILFRDISRGSENFNPPPGDPLCYRGPGIPVTLEMIKGQTPIPAMTVPMIAGFPLGPGSQGNYTAEGYPHTYMPRPAQIYTGSYDPNPSDVAAKSFLSGIFHPTADYIMIDVLVDKSARLENYHLNGLQLTLCDETTGQRIELLPQLAHSFPFIFRDWEWVYSKVIPGHEYRIESHTTDPKQWIAFGEPFESGRLTPFIVIVGQSGKLLCLCGLGFLFIYFALGYRNAFFPHREA